MDSAGRDQENRAYYDAFSKNYERVRGANDPGGYHELLDELESEFVRRFGAGKDVLEVGCGTGLVLDRIARFAKSAKGLDLSPGMLEKARERGLDVVLGSATALPFADNSFDVVCSFKVLAHIKDIELAVSELTRVVRPGGYVIAEFYNPHSLRGLLKRFLPAGRIAHGKRESDVFTRFDSPTAVAKLVPYGSELVASRGVRILTPTAQLMRIGVLRPLLYQAERWLADSQLKRFAGFYIVVWKKH
ncbi:MAG: class I SAM-dependent methyltransferase [Polyangiaceae bacterium]|nr:class I SAM-dependent methyltransferase [Polyangiaceae bacterium]